MGFELVSSGNEIRRSDQKLGNKKLWPGNLNFCEPQMTLTYRLDAISQGQKSLDFQGPTPFYLLS
jgi:hypothetical protein